MNVYFCSTNSANRIYFVSLTELKEFAEKGSVLSGMQELNAARLSVSKVSEKEWAFIVNELVEGYEEDDDVDGAASAAAADVKTTVPLPALTTPPLEPYEQGNGLPEGFVLVKDTIESTLPTTDSMLPTDLAAPSSKPASRAGSRKASSRAGSRPPSRNGSLAPPAASSRPASRGRSRTPRAGSAQPMGVVAEEMEVVFE